MGTMIAITGNGSGLVHLKPFIRKKDWWAPFANFREELKKAKIVVRKVSMIYTPNDYDYAFLKLTYDGVVAIAKMDLESYEAAAEELYTKFNNGPSGGRYCTSIMKRKVNPILHKKFPIELIAGAAHKARRTKPKRDEHDLKVGDVVDVVGRYDDDCKYLTGTVIRATKTLVTIKANAINGNNVAPVSEWFPFNINLEIEYRFGRCGWEQKQNRFDVRINKH